jgi:hypothetical protein
MTKPACGRGVASGITNDLQPEAATAVRRRKAGNANCGRDAVAETGVAGNVVSSRFSVVSALCVVQ